MHWKIDIDFMKIKSKLQACFGITISLTLVVIVLGQVEFDRIGAALSQANITWLILALIFYWAEILIRVYRWKRLLITIDATISSKVVFNSFCLGAAVNNILPFRFGEILKAHLVGIQRNISRYSLMATIILEKLIDVAAVLLLTCWGAFGVLEKIAVTSNMNIVFFIACLGFFAVCGACMLAKGRHFPNRAVLFFRERLELFSKGLGILLRPGNLSLVLVDTVFIWVFNSLAIWAIVRSLDVSLSLSEVLLLEGISGLAAAIPSAPAGIGTMQYAYLITFDMLHLDKLVGVTASLLMQGVLLGSITLVGLLIFILDSKSRVPMMRLKHE